MISVVIPLYRRKECIFRLLEDLLCQEGVDFEIIVVDDNSADGSAEEILVKYPKVQVLINQHNRGPCVSRNRGVKAARGEVIVGLDSDVTIPDREMLARVLGLFRELPSWRGLAFRVLAEDGKKDDIPRWWHPVSVEKYSKCEFETDYFSGTAFAFRRDELLSIGLFPEQIFQYFEEVEVAFRFLDAGGKITYRPDFSVIHHAGGRSGWSEHRYFHNPRSQILFVVGTYPLARGLLYLMPRLVKHFTQAVTNGTTLIFLRGCISGIRDACEGLSKRSVLKKETWDRISKIRTQGKPASV